MFNKFYNLCAGYIRKLPLIKKYPALKEFIKYSLVGNLSNLVDFAVYIYLTRVFVFWYNHYLITNVITMVLASSLRFPLQKHWTFKNNDNNVYTQYLKLIIVLTISLFINELILFIAVEKFAINDILGKFIGLAIASLNSYAFTRLWVFQCKDKKN